MAFNRGGLSQMQQAQPRAVRDGGPTGLDLGNGNTLAWLGGYGKSAYDVNKLLDDPFSRLGMQGFGSGNKKYGDELNRVLAYKALQAGDTTFDAYKAVRRKDQDNEFGNDIWDKELIGQRNVSDFFDPTKKYILGQDTELAKQLQGQKYLNGPGGNRSNEMLAGLLGRGVTSLDQLAPDGQGGFINKATGQRISGDIGKTFAGHGMSELKLGSGPNGQVTPYAQWKDTGDKKTIGTLATIASLAGMAFGIPPAVLAAGNSAVTLGMTGDPLEALKSGAGTYIGAKMPGWMGGLTKGMNPYAANALTGAANAGVRGGLSGKGLKGSLQDAAIGAAMGVGSTASNQFVRNPLAQYAQQNGFSEDLARRIGQTGGRFVNQLISDKAQSRNTDLTQLALNSGLGLTNLNPMARGALSQLGGNYLRRRG